MKKAFRLFALTLILVGILAGSAGAFQPETYIIPSTSQSGDYTGISGAGYFAGITVITDGTNSVTVDIYDNTALSGTKLIPTWVVPTSSTLRSQTYNLDPMVPFNNGLGVDVTTAGTVTFMLYYRMQ
jgi:hypothetical protein